MPLIIMIKVVPGSKKLQLLLDKTGALKCYVMSQPERGKANKELIEYLAKTLGIAQTSVIILKGESSRIKKIEIIKNITLNELLMMFGIEKQTALF